MLTAYPTASIWANRWRQRFAKSLPSISSNVRSFMVVCTIPLPPGRDVRLDLFRGLANWAIFLDHIPHEVLNSITTRNYGFSDAADLFVFISGYTAAFVFGRIMIERGYVAAMSRLARRASELYIAHIIVVTIYIISMSPFSAASRSGNLCRPWP